MPRPKTQGGGGSSEKKSQISVYLEKEIEDLLRETAEEDGRKAPSLAAHLLKMVLPAYRKSIQRNQQDVEDAIR